MKNIYYIRQMITAVFAFIFLLWAFFQNELFARIIISPFLICSFAIFFERLFYLLNKEKLSNIFKYFFRLTFFIYAIGFLIYTVYYAIVNKTYSLLIVVAIFTIAIIPFMRLAFPKKKKNK